ncbi:hypothetical protein [Streptomyces albireticuli]|uniref:Uncharacterized protein n=1 Tax=Streptomyces albireticuli TaxID=1940 RepID=A0A2A2CXQ8_9ACTN|nr:hypothetical protein [Streptomyces albireticuli]MCD9194377.1 hypothetical protein [Streptomyces albireticuli]PAU44035.1 hypothetical protein CK936_37015 [Streptomyces albireticuli]
MFGGGKRDDEALRDFIRVLHRESDAQSTKTLNQHQASLRGELQELRGLIGKAREEVQALRLELTELRAKADGAFREAADDRAHRLEEAREAREARLARPPEPLPPFENVVLVQAPEEGPAPRAAGENAEADEAVHLGLLRSAAGVSAATLVCHRDTWAFLVEQAGQETHFRVPGRVRAGEGKDEGMVEVSVSGPSLIATVTVLARIRDEESADSGSRALAWQLYERIAEELRKARPHPGPGTGPGSDPDADPGDGPAPVEAAPPEPAADEPWPEAIRIVIDDRPAP